MTDLTSCRLSLVYAHYEMIMGHSWIHLDQWSFVLKKEISISMNQYFHLLKEIISWNKNEMPFSLITLPQIQKSIVMPIVSWLRRSLYWGAVNWYSLYEEYKL